MNVYTYKTDAMRRILQLVSRGYIRYTFGKCELKKLQSLICKFDDRYKINLTTQQRYRAKAKGEANTQLVLFFNGKTIEWWLLVTPGKGLVDQMEDLKDALGRKSRIEFGGYELAIMPSKISCQQTCLKKIHPIPTPAAISAAFFLFTPTPAVLTATPTPAPIESACITATFAVTVAVNAAVNAAVTPAFTPAFTPVGIPSITPECTL